MRFKDKGVLVTGGGSGIGLATALAFLREGARVAIADLSPEHGEEARSAARAEGHDVLFVKGDVSREADAKASVDAAVSAFGRLDVVFNGAGILIEVPVHEMAAEDWDRVLAVNLRGVFLVSKHAVRHMIDHGGGAIVNAGSVNSLVGDADSAAYCASKGGVALLTKSMALAYARHGIRVNAVAPGWVETRMFSQEAETRGVSVAAYRASAGRQHPIGRIGRPEEIAALVLFLASDEASYITGDVVVADGGYTAR